MELNTVIHGSCLDVIKTFPDKSVNCVITSPPYWNLRDYKWDGQWGLEPTFTLYLENLWSLMDEIWRVLKDDGSAWVNLGDTYARGSRPCDSGNQLGHKNKDNFQSKSKPDYEGLNKCLLLIPHRFGIGCIDRGWLIRNDIVWAKRNGMPESVTDRFSKKHEYFFFMTKQEKYYFDLDGIRDKHKYADDKRNDGQRHEYAEGVKSQNNKWLATNAVSFNPIGKNPGSVADFWDIPTKGSNDDHYASYNTKLIDKPIMAGCPKGGIILDPFCGTATTGCRAIDLGRKFIGIEGSADYVKIANKKLHPFQIVQQLF